MRIPVLMMFTWLITFHAHAQPDTLQRINPNSFNDVAQQQKPYVIMISCDGFRYDYAVKYAAKNILSLSKNGIRAEGMIPSYPSLTYPNHHSLITGMYPSHHGLVSNYFYDKTRQESYEMSKRWKVKDGTWYGGMPLWVLAEQQHLLTGSLFWVASEADIHSIRPTYYYNYHEAFSNQRQIEIIVAWLRLPAERRPHFITVYFPQADHAGHDFGPDAPETKAAVKELDDIIYQLTRAVTTTGLDVNYVLVSDHGMTKVDIEHPVAIPDVVDTAKFIIPKGRELMMLYAKDPAYIQPTYEKLKAFANGYSVYLEANVPAYLHYGKSDDYYNRIGDIIMIPEPPRIFAEANSNPKLGAHGFDPVKNKDMQAIFYAWGPAFKQGITVPAFENVDVFPVISSLLGLKYPESIDGTNQLAERILK